MRKSNAIKRVRHIGLPIQNTNKSNDIQNAIIKAGFNPPFDTTDDSQNTNAIKRGRHIGLPLQNTNKIFMFFVLGIILSLFSSCVNHIDPYRPKKRVYKYEGPEFKQKAPKNGSLYSETSEMANLFTDMKAFREGDIVTIIISESATASGEANTESSKATTTEASVDTMFNFMNYIKTTYPNVNPTKLLSQSYSDSFEGGGKTSRKGTISATVASTIKQVLPSGNYFIEGNKVLLVNDEEHHFYISGIVRPNDIKNDNSILSSKIAEMQIEFTGRGMISNKQSQGWFSSVIDWIWPF